MNAIGLFETPMTSSLGRIARFVHRAVLAAPILAAAGCASLPSAGPLTGDIHDESTSENGRPFALVELSVASLELVRLRPAPSLQDRFGESSSNSELLLGPGDGVSLYVWEAGSDPLFSPIPVSGALGSSPSGTRAATLAEQIVGSDGTISIPFAGRLSVAGLDAAQVQSAVERALTGKAQKPQVLVNVTRNAANTVTVVGDVASGARVPLTPHGERLLDVLAAAGGTRAPTYETQVQLTRGASSVSMPLDRVLEQPTENIPLRPGDTLVVTRRPETFTVFGATGRNAQITFDAARVNLVEGLAKAGGLQDSRADPRGVFLFRYEPRELVARFGTLPPELASLDWVPVVYRLDLTRAGSYFVAREFELQDRDMLYVASARANEWQKFLQLLGLLTQPAINAVVVDSATQ